MCSQFQMLVFNKHDQNTQWKYVVTCVSIFLLFVFIDWVHKESSYRFPFKF